MAQVSYPGVYIEEVSSGVHTITSVATSIAAFFGRASKGPMNKAVRCLSISDFNRAFGAPHPQSDLAASVKQFFANGGSDCYVVRIARNTAKAAITLRSLAGAGQPVLVATAKADGAWANTVRLEVDYNTINPHETFNLRVIHEEGGVAVANESFTNLSMNPTSARFAPDFVTQSSNLIDLRVDAGLGDPDLATAPINLIANSFAGFSQSRRPLSTTAATAAGTLNGLIAPVAPTPPQTSFDISVNDSGYVTVNLTGWTAPSDFALIGTQLADRINTELATLSAAPTVKVAVNAVTGVGRLITITAANGNTSAVRVRRAASNDIAAALMLGVDQGGIESTRWSNFRPAPNASIVRLGNPATPGDLATVNALAALTQNAITQLTIDGTPVALNAAPFNLVTTAGGDRWTVNAAGASAATGDNDGVREKLRIIAGAINANALLAFRAEVWGYQLALLAKSGTSNAIPATVATTVAGFDNGVILNTRQYSLGTGGTSAFSTGGVAGNDGVFPQAAQYFGNPTDQTGFYALDPVDLFNLMVIPADAEVDETIRNSLWGPASNYAASRRAFLLIDAPLAWTTNAGRPAVVGNTALINDLRVSLVKANSAVFYPRLVYDAGGLTKTIGASGAIAGLMARIDATRGVWKAPAGIEADIRDVLGVDVKLTDLENGVLNKKGVNCLRVFPNGLVNWGARTLDGDDDFGSEWKYIPIRRLALNIEESLFRGTKWIVFEPNDEPLWAKIRLNLNAFMMSLFRQGAFQGTNPKDAFYVKCDSETTTQDDRNKGIVNIEVGFAPLKPAEFVVIKIQQIAGKL